jgi:hypothetical protein
MYVLRKIIYLFFFNFSEMKVWTPHIFLQHEHKKKCTAYYCSRTAVYPGSAGDSYHNISLFFSDLVVIFLEYKLMHVKHCL